MFLTADELTQLTKRKRSASQLKVLNAMGIDHARRPDGSVVVLRTVVEKVLDSTLATAKITVKKNEPDWGKAK